MSAPAVTTLPPPADPLEQAVQAGERMLAELPGTLSRLLAAGLLIAAGLLVLSMGRRLIRRAFSNRSRQKDTSGQERTLQSLLLSLFNFLLYFAIATAALSALGVDVSSLLAVAGVGGVAIGFGCQSLVKDFVSGLFLWIEGRMNVGDTVTVGGQTGTVEAMALRTTTLRGANGSLYTIPNGDIRTVINLTRDYRCALVDITVAHGQDYQRVLGLLQDGMEELDQRLESLTEAPQVLGIVASDGRAVTVRIECKCKVEEGWALEREIRLAALKCLEKEGIRP